MEVPGMNLLLIWEVNSRGLGENAYLDFTENSQIRQYRGWRQLSVDRGYWRLARGRWLRLGDGESNRTNPGMS